MQWALACSQNRGLSKYQRRASRLPYGAGPPWRQRGRLVTARGGRQGPAAVQAPDTASSTKLWTGSHLLTMSSWNPGQLTSARSGTAWDQLPRGGNTHHTRDCALEAHPGNWAAKTGQVNKMHGPPGTLFTKHLVTWAARSGKGTKHTAHLGLCPCGAPKNPSGLGLRRAWNAGSTWDSALAEHPGAWALWTQEVHAALGCGKPSVVHPLWALPTHASSISLQCPSFPTTQLNKWA